MPPDCDPLKGIVAYRPLVGPARENYTSNAANLSDSLAFAIALCLDIFTRSTDLTIIVLYCIKELEVPERVYFSS